MGDQAEQLRTAAREKRTESSYEKKSSFAGKSKVFTITSGKGGVGKTSLVVNLGLALTRIGYKVVVIDADLGLPNIDVMTNSFPSHNIDDVISGTKNIREIIMEGPMGLKMVPGGSGFYDLTNLSQTKRDILLKQLVDLENEGDFILIDTAAGISRNVISMVEAGDEFILITTPEPTAMTDAYSLLKVVFERGLRKEGRVVVNLTRNPDHGQKVYSGFNRVIQQYLPEMNLNYLGDVRYDPAVSNAVHNFTPFVVSRPQSIASTAVNRIAWRIAANSEVEEQPRQGLAGFIDRLKGKGA